MNLIQVVDLHAWGMRNDAREKIGSLVEALVRTTLPPDTNRRIRFLYGAATQLPGWDGVVDTVQGNVFVPEGKSVWELGTGGGGVGKVRTDFEKRKEAALPEGWERSETTYVAVATSMLQDSEALQSELLASSGWKAVKVIDSVGLAHWLPLSPQAETWAYEQVNGRPLDGIETLVCAWARWTSITSPEIVERLLTVARDGNVGDVATQLASGEEIVLEADSPDEGVAFLVAALRSLPESIWTSAGEKGLVISGASQAENFPATAVPQMLVLKGGATTFARKLERKGHRVISVHGKSARSQRRGLVLSRQPRKDFAGALSTMGIPEESALIQARACGSSSSIWRVWNLYHCGNAEGILPEWASDTYLDVVVPAVLLGGWDQDKADDLAVIEQMTGLKYEEFFRRLQHVQGVGENFLEMAGNVVRVAAPATAFAIVSSRIDVSSIRLLRDCASMLFSTIDPMIDVEPDKRMYASISGQVLPHSEWLRDGVAESILRIAVLGGELEKTGALGHSKSCQGFVDSLFRELPGLRENYRLIASLRDQLPVLAEAAPLPFFEALEHLLQGDRDGLTRLFSEGGEFGGHSLLPAVLWAIETLAWDKDHLPRACLILAGLHKIDPGGRTGNRPMSSLTSILLPWFPNTAATVSERSDVLDLLLEREPQVAWSLLMEVMPGARRTATRTHRPLWRECGIAEDANTPRNEVADAFVAVIDRAIDHCGTADDRIAQLLGRYADLSRSHRQALEAKIVYLLSLRIGAERTFLTWEALRELVGKHREFPSAAWALDEVTLDRLQGLVDQLQPTDVVKKHAWLFQDYSPDIGIAREDHDAYEALVSVQRKEAVREILSSSEPMTRLFELVDGSNYPDFVAAALAEVESNPHKLLSIFVQAARSNPRAVRFAKALSCNAFHRLEDKWVDLLLSRSRELPDGATIAVVGLLGFPDSMTLFEKVASLGNEIERSFWQEHVEFVRTKDRAAQVHAVKMLTKHGRARDALLLVSQSTGLQGAEESIQLLQLAWDEMARGPSASLGHSFDYWVGKLFDRLGADKTVDRSELARVEYKYLPMLTRHGESRSLVLHEILATEPQFFIEVIRDLYKPANSDREETGRSKEELTIRAHYAFELLATWHRPPGMSESGTLEYEALSVWVLEARKLAAECDRSEIADQHVGKVLYYVPADREDLTWPDCSLRRLLEALGNRNIETGIEVEQFNARGTTSRSFLEGGEQERVLANKWRESAARIGVRWPRTHAMLIRISEAWEFTARQEDESARQDEMRFR